MCPLIIQFQRGIICPNIFYISKDMQFFLDIVILDLHFGCFIRHVEFLAGKPSKMQKINKKKL